jgi:hypothetical protein
VVLQDVPEVEVKMVLRVLEENRDLQVSMALRGLKVLRVLRALRDLKETRASQLPTFGLILMAILRSQCLTVPRLTPVSSGTATVTPLSTRVAVEVALVEVGPLRETTMTLRVFRVAQLMSAIT